MKSKVIFLNSKIRKILTDDNGTLFVDVVTGDVVPDIEDASNVSDVTDVVLPDKIHKMQQIDMQEQIAFDQKMDELRVKIEHEIDLEQTRNQKLIALESAKQGAINQAIIMYGTNADIRSIMAYYNGIASTLQPHTNGILDSISIALDNQLNKADNVVKIVSKDGSIRVMDRDVAEFLLSRKTCYTPGRNLVKEVQADTNIDSYALMKEMNGLDRTKELENLDRVQDLFELMEINHKRQMRFNQFSGYDSYRMYRQKNELRKRRCQSFDFDDMCY